jgi:hypothetical protein
MPCTQCGLIPPLARITRMETFTVDEVVRQWFESDKTMFDACTEAPEIAWSAILQIFQRELTEEQMSLLAAGPVETLLSHHGPAFIERVEREAQQSSRFRYLLAGVWRLGMTQDVWDRVRRARGEQL